MAHKKVFSAPDAAPTVIYAKQSQDSEHAFPLLQDSGNLKVALSDADVAQLEKVAAGVPIPGWRREITVSGTTTTIEFYRDSVLVVTRTIDESGAPATITIEDT